MTIALAEEFGELAKAMLDESGEAVWKEAVQTAAMAARVAIDGDSSVDEWRAQQGLGEHREKGRAAQHCDFCGAPRNARSPLCAPPFTVQPHQWTGKRPADRRLVREDFRPDYEDEITEGQIEAIRDLVQPDLRDQIRSINVGLGRCDSLDDDEEPTQPYPEEERFQALLREQEDAFAQEIRGEQKAQNPDNLRELLRPIVWSAVHGDMDVLTALDLLRAHLPDLLRTPETIAEIRRQGWVEASVVEAAFREGHSLGRFGATDRDEDPDWQSSETLAHLAEARSHD